MPNRLAHETSPYLLQHKDNPVDWYPWGAEALDRARAEDKPILLSVGYAACHWCHVMAHESFEDARTAEAMNALFVNIKVDREERPDLDAIYMDAVQAMTRHGGWPMTVFLTPAGEPFFGGTYFPPTARGGLPSFVEVLSGVAAAFNERRDEVTTAAAGLRGHLQSTLLLRPPTDAALMPHLMDTAAGWLSESFDAQHGGFGPAPKFPQPMTLDFLLRQHARTGANVPLRMATLTLDAMARGGMYDQLGGGFHRYSTDQSWLVPHFEKMLYDNALLAPVYLHAWQITGTDFYRQITEETLDWILREMTNAEGAFYSTLDADSEGVEGKFYVWTPDELAALLPETDAQIVAAYWDVTPGGNWEGHSILHVVGSVRELAAAAGMTPEDVQGTIDRAKPVLLAARAGRVWPGLDDKTLTAWNGFAIRAFAEAGAAFDRPDYRAAAERAADFALHTLRRDGRLLRTYKDGQAKIAGYLEDYAALADGLLALYAATFAPRWLDEARSLTATMLDLFWDEGSTTDDGTPTGAGFFDTARDAEALITRPRGLTDNATPAGNSLAVEVLLRLAALDDRPDYRDKAEQSLRTLRDAMTRHPSAFGRLLSALDFAVAPPREVVVAGDPEAPDTQALVGVLRSKFRPNLTVAVRPPGASDDALPPLLQGREMIGGVATVYVCENYACNLPITTPEELARQLGDA